MKKYFPLALLTALIILIFFFAPWRSDILPAAKHGDQLTPVAQNGKARFLPEPPDSIADENRNSQTPDETADFVVRWLQQVRLSERPQDLLLAGLLSKNDPADKETFLLRAFEVMPDNLLLNYAIADYCGHNSHASLCAIVSPRRLIELDSDNGFMWTTVAGQAYRNGDIDDALRYLQQAVGLYKYNSQAPQLMQLIDDSLIYHGAQRTFGLVEHTMGIHAAQVLPSQYGQLTDMCREQSQWQDTCRQLGQTMMSQGRDPMDVAIGRQLAGEFSSTRELPPAPAEWEKFAESAASQEQQRLIAVLIAENPPVAEATWHEYLRLYETAGAPAAFYYLVETLLAPEN